MTKQEREKAIDKLGYNVFRKNRAYNQVLFGYEWEDLYPSAKSLFTDEFNSLNDEELLALMLAGRK